MGSSAPRRQSGAPALSILLLSHSLGCSPDLHGWIQVPWNISSPGFWKGNTEPQSGKAACLRLEMTPELHISLLLTFHCPVLGHVIISSVQSLSRVRLFATPWITADSLQPHESQHARPPCPSPSPRVHSNSRPSSQWCHPAILSSVVPSSSCPQSLPASDHTYLQKRLGS